MDDRSFESPPEEKTGTETDSTPRRAVPQKKARNRGRGLLIVVGAIALFSLSLGGTYLAAQILNHQNTPDGAQAPEQAVLSYLQALAAGHADTALIYSAMQPDDRTFTSDEFLAQLLAENPITKITVPPNQATDSPAVIEATYNIGDVEVEAEFTLHLQGNAWLLDYGFFPFDISEMTESGPAISMNGVDLGHTENIYLFPGIYTLTLADPMLALTYSEFVIEYPEMPLFFSQGYTMSEEGLDVIRTAVDEHLTYCLAQKDIQPDGCGFGFAGTSTGTIDTSTIAWTIAGTRPSFAAQKFTLDTTVLTVATAMIDIKFHFEAISTDKRHFYEADSSITGIRVDFCRTDQIVVTFGTFG